jgi:hypothetical protein
MSASTRNRLMMCLVIGLITLPAEALLFPVARTPNPAVAAAEWTASLDPTELRAAASNIDAYPSPYRRAIMTALAPADRAQAWRGHFHAYIAAHPELTADQLAALRESIDVITPDAFAVPVASELRDRIGKAFAHTQQALGVPAATELFVTLGSKELKKASALPLTQRIADTLRSWRVVSASASDSTASIVDCNCNIDIDTCDLEPDPWLICSEQYTCEFDLSWPMCGPLWSWACTGWCKVIRWPWENR